jgi:hypothetical protein
MMFSCESPLLPVGDLQSICRYCMFLLTLVLDTFEHCDLKCDIISVSTETFRSSSPVTKIKSVLQF